MLKLLLVFLGITQLFVASPLSQNLKRRSSLDANPAKRTKRDVQGSDEMLRDQADEAKPAPFYKRIIAVLVNSHFNYLLDCDSNITFLATIDHASPTYETSLRMQLSNDFLAVTKRDMPYYHYLVYFNTQNEMEWSEIYASGTYQLPLSKALLYVVFKQPINASHKQSLYELMTTGMFIIYPDNITAAFIISE